MTTTTELPRVPRTVPEWHEMGACQLLPELDFIEAKAGSPQALACRIVCAACPVRKQCAEGALERRERWGIWGGLDYRDRKHVAAAYGYLPPGDPPEHGTNSRRVKWGCSCPDCKRAHALYEAERRAKARTAAKRRGLWTSPLCLARPIRIGRRRLPAGQYLLPLPGIPAPREAQPEPALLLAA